MMEVREIEISRIKVIRNIRTDIGDLGSLMTSMQQDGLKQPIGVWKEGEEYFLSFGYRRLQAAIKLGWKTIDAVISNKKLTEEEFIITNAIENIQRLETSPLELGNVCSRLRGLKLSITEIAARLSLPVGRVKAALEAYQRVPDKYKSHIGYVPQGTPKKGKIPVSSALAIANSRLNKEDKDKLFDTVKDRDLSNQQLRILIQLVYTGASFNEALRQMNECRVHTMHVVLNKQAELQVKAQHEGETTTSILQNVLVGVYSAPKNLVTWRKKEKFK